MNKRRHPDWLKVPIAGGQQYYAMKSMLRSADLHTICEEARCPNIAECFGNGTAVFLILGDTCTRSCRYCNVNHGIPKELNLQEPQNVAMSVHQLGLKYVVITSVTRDDLPDGGAQVFSDTILAIKQKNPRCYVEVLIPDFNGAPSALQTVLQAQPDVINHNIEVVQALFPTIRPQGDYQRSLQVLHQSKTFDPTITTKSGFMIGLGEQWNDILQTMSDLRQATVDLLTIGQYLQPTSHHAPIQKYYTPKQFQELKTIALSMGFSHVESGPLVRSSYHAERCGIRKGEKETTKGGT